jgi:hypothetical protein
MLPHRKGTKKRRASRVILLGKKLNKREEDKTIKRQESSK